MWVCKSVAKGKFPRKLTVSAYFAAKFRAQTRALSMAAKKQILQLALLEEDFFEGAALIGVVSALPPSRFCAVLNRCFDLCLRREPEQDLWMQIGQKDGPKQYFPVFQERLEAEAVEMTVYRLKGGGEMLLPELPHLDYMWLLRSNTPEKDAENYAALLRRLDGVQMAQLIGFRQLSNAANLVI